MAERRIYKWDIWCNEEAKTYTLWSETLPTTCPYDAEHTLDQNKTKIKDVLVDGAIEARIQERDIESTTGGHYGAETLNVDDIPAVAGWHERDFSFPFDIDLLAAEWVNKADMEGDNVEVLLAPETNIGDIVDDVAADADTLKLPQEAIDLARVGFFVKIADGTNTDDLGRILSIDNTAKTIKVETKTINAFLAVTPSTVKMTRKFVSSGRFHGEGTIHLGDEKIGSSILKANTIIRIRYENKDGVAGKKLPIWIKFLY